MNNQPNKVYAAALTPFSRDLQVDTALLARHCGTLLAGGCDGVSLFGTTGEANSMSIAERINGLEAVLEGGIPARTLMPGTGCCSVIDSVILTKHALANGVTDVLVLPPFFYKNVSDDGVFDAYAYLIDKVDDPRLRVYLYHIPQYSGVPLGLELIARLRAAYPDIVVGIKDSSADAANLLSLCALEGFRVFVGAERLIRRALHAGAAGTICALGNTSGETLAALCADAGSDSADGLQSQITAELDLVDRYGFIPALKAHLAVEQQNATWENVRPPLTGLATARRFEVNEAFEGLAVAR